MRAPQVLSDTMRDHPVVAAACVNNLHKTLQQLLKRVKTMEAERDVALEALTDFGEVLGPKVLATVTERKAFRRISQAREIIRTTRRIDGKKPRNIIDGSSRAIVSGRMKTDGSVQ